MLILAACAVCAGALLGATVRLPVLVAAIAAALAAAAACAWLGAGGALLPAMVAMAGGLQFGYGAVVVLRALTGARSARAPSGGSEPRGAGHPPGSDHRGERCSPNQP